MGAPCLGVNGDLAYTVAIESYAASLRGEPPAPQEFRCAHVDVAVHFQHRLRRRRLNLEPPCVDSAH